MLSLKGGVSVCLMETRATDGSEKEGKATRQHMLL